MKRWTFTCVLEGEEPAGMLDASHFVDIALTRGDKNQDYTLFHKGEIKVEEIGDGS